MNHEGNKRRNVSRFADPYSLAGSEKYPQKLMVKRARDCSSANESSKKKTVVSRKPTRNSAVIVHRTGHLFVCPCDSNRQSFVENMPECTESDLDRFYPPCLHIQAVRNIYKAFMATNDIKVENSIDLDHCYGVEKGKSSENDAYIVPIDFMENTYAIHNSGQFGLVKITSGKVKCITCKTIDCCHTKHLNKLLVQQEKTETVDTCILDDIYLQLHRPLGHSTELMCLSSKKIPYKLTPLLQEVIKKNPKEVFEIDENELQAVEKTNNCNKCGSILIKQAEESHVLLTKYNILPIKCYRKICETCQEEYVYDGLNECVLHMRGYLVHYEVMRDFMFSFLYSRCTMYSFYNVWQQHQKDGGNDNFSQIFPIALFRQSWYSFMKLLDIDYGSSFRCSDCGDHPNTLLFDGTSLSFRKAFLNSIISPLCSGNKLEGSRHSDRVFINNADTRHLLLEFTKTDATKCFDIHKFKSMIEVHQPSLLPLLGHFESIGCTTTCPEEYRSLLKLLSSNSAVCGTFHCLNIQLMKELIQMSQIEDPLSDQTLMFGLQQFCPIVFDLLTNLKGCPPYLFPLFEKIIEIAELPFEGSVHQLIQCSNEDHLAFFPSLMKLYERGIYKMDKMKTSQGECRKKGSSHPSLLPGIFTVFCEHGICYGFEVMEIAESPNRPFTFLRTRFKKPPGVIIYDNSCNLHNYCLNRDPVFFKDTVFVVDGLHWDNHIGCVLGYKALLYPFLSHINTQLVEQNNAKLKKLKSSLSYMTEENFMNSVKFFLHFCNENVNS